MGGSIKKPGLLGVGALLLLGIGYVSDVGGAYQAFASLKAVFVKPSPEPAHPNPNSDTASTPPAVASLPRQAPTQQMDQDTLMSMEGVRGGLHKKKATAILRQISGRSYCGDGFSMRFRVEKQRLYLDATYMTGSNAYNQTAEIELQGYSDQYNAVMYFNPILEESRMVAVRAGGDHINDMTYYTEQHVESYVKERCSVNW